MNKVRVISKQIRALAAGMAALWSTLLLGGCGKSSSIGVIGGADGPTAIFVAGKTPGGRSSVLLILLVALVVVIGFVSWWRQKKK